MNINLNHMINRNDYFIEKHIQQKIAAQTKIQKPQHASQEEIAQLSSMVPTEKPLPPWHDLMIKLDIQPTGSINGDYQAISSKLQQLQSVARTESQKSEIESLNTEFTQAFSNLPEAPQKQPQVNQLQGLEYMAMMNKAFILGQ